MGKSLDFLQKNYFSGVHLIKKWVSEKLRCLSDLNQSLNGDFMFNNIVSSISEHCEEVKQGHTKYSDWFRSLRHLSFSETHFFIKSHIMNAGKIDLGKKSRDLPSVTGYVLGNVKN